MTTLLAIALAALPMALIGMLAARVLTSEREADGLPAIAIGAFRPLGI